MLNSIYSNLDTISFYKLIRNTEELIKRGYNPALLRRKKTFLFIFTIFSCSDGMFAGIFTLNDNEKKQNNIIFSYP